MKSFLPKPSFKVDDIISYAELVAAENANIQKGMNFQIKPEYSVFLMSVRKNAPYADEWDAKTNTLIYEGHDAPINIAKEPKEADQPLQNTQRNINRKRKIFYCGSSLQNEVERASA